MAQQKKKPVHNTARKAPLAEQPSSGWYGRYSNILLSAALIIITYIFYSNSLNSGFVLLDDTAKIIDNSLITSLSWEHIKTMFGTFTFHTYFPVTLLSYSIDYAVYGGLEPHGFHTTSLLLHITNVVLLFIFVKTLTGKNNASFIAAIIFAVHPMNVETVAWLSERSNLLYTLFFLASMISYVKHMQAKDKKIYLVFVYLFFLLSLLSKSSAVILPLVFILIDYYNQNKISFKILLNKIPYLIISLVFGIIAIYATTSTENIHDISVTYTFFDRIFLALYPLVYYVVKFFVPLNLSVLYPYPLKSDGFLPLSYYLSVLPLLLFIFLTVKYKPLKKYLTFAFLFFFLNISVLLMIVPIGGNFLMAEHFVYVPYIGFAIIAGIIFSNIYDKTIKTKIPAAVFLALYYILIPLFCLATFDRNKVWKSSTALFTDLIEEKPDNAFVHYCLGTLYIEKQNYKNAYQELNLSIQFDSTYANAFYNRAISEMKLYDIDAAMSDFNRAINLNPEYQMAYVDRGNLKAEKGDTTGAISDFNEAIRISSTNSLAFYNRGRMNMNQKKYEEALADFDMALSIYPNYIDAYNNRGITKYFMKDYSGSIEDYNVVIKLDDKYANAYKNRGLSKMALADSTGACEDYYKAFGMGLKDVVMLIKKNCN
jgi:protein O-mannosyl-transferase